MNYQEKVKYYMELVENNMEVNKDSVKELFDKISKDKRVSNENKNKMLYRLKKIYISL